MDVIVSPEAQSDLREICDFIGQDNPDRAQSFGDELLMACRSLSRTGARMAIVPAFRDLSLRKIVRGNYLIFFYIENETVYVARIVHGSRDYEPMLRKGVRKMKRRP